MTALSLLLLYGGIFVVGGLVIAVALVLTSPPSSHSEQSRPPSDEAVDPIRSLGF
jgi:hypothetical protein